MSRQRGPTAQSPATSAALATGSSPWTGWLVAGLLTFAAFAVYHNGLHAPFVFDDEPAILNNPTIRHLWPLWDPLSAPPTLAGAAGRPLVNLSLAVNYALGGLDVWGYRVTNVLLHLAAALVLFGLVRRTFHQPVLRDRFGPRAAASIALFTALLWTVHPLLTESVTCVVQRNEAMVGFFLLLTLYCLVRAASSTSPRWWLAGSFLACTLGMASKEVMVSAPLLAVFYEVIFIDGSWRAAWRRRGKFFALLALSWLPLALLVTGNSSRFGTVGFDIGVSWWDYALTQCRAIVMYLQLASWPHPLVVDYGETLVNGPADVWLQALLLIGLFGATVVALAKKKPAGFAGLCFFAILAPSSSFLPLATQTMAEHRMYLPLAAVLVLAVTALHSAVGARSLAVVSAVAIGCGLLTARRNQDYRNSLVLWTDTVAKAPANARAHSNLGSALAEAGQIEAARTEFETSLRLKPNFPMSHFNLGNVLSQLGRLPEAIDQYEEALREDPTLAKVCNNLGGVLVRQSRWAEAEAEYRAALRLQPDYPEAENNLGNVLTSEGHPAEAIPHFATALRAVPGEQTLHYNLATALANAGRDADAIAQLQTVVQLAPQRADAHCHLGILLAAAGQRDDAIRELLTALRLRPGYEEATVNLTRLGYPVPAP